MLPVLSKPRFSWPTVGTTSALRRDVDDLFDRFFGRSWEESDGRTVQNWQVPLSIWEDEQSIYVEAELPGMSQEDIEIIVQKGELTLRGERKLPQKQRNYCHNERPFGKFERVIALSEMIDTDNVEAHISSGVLSIKLMKQPEARPKKVAIKSE